MGEAESKRLRVGMISSIAGLDPRETSDGITNLVLRQIYEPPYELPSAHSSPQPLLLAESLQDESGGKATLFSAPLRSDIRFSEGSPLSIDLALRSLQKSKVVLDKAAVEKRGDKLVFVPRERNPKIDVLLAQTHCAIVLEKGMELFGTGPFMFEPHSALRSLQATDQIRLIRNPHYHGRLRFDEIVYTIYPPDANGRPTSLLEAMKRGEVDLTTNLTSADMPNVDLANFHPVIQPGSSTAFLFFNSEKPGLKDVRVRRAIAVGLDPSRVAERSYERNPLAYVARNILPPMMSRDEQLFHNDRREAEQILSDPDVQKPARLNLLVPWGPRPYAPTPRLMGESIRDQLGAWGIEVDVVQAKTSEEFYARMIPGNYELVLAGWIADTPDPADFFESLLHSQAVLRQGVSSSHSINLSRLKNPAMDAALREFREDPSEDRKKVIFDLVRETIPFVPLVTSQNIVVHSRRVRNFRASPAGDPFLGQIELA